MYCVMVVLVGIRRLYVLYRGQTGIPLRGVQGALLHVKSHDMFPFCTVTEINKL